jgi:hypothetical protein
MSVVTAALMAVAVLTLYLPPPVFFLWAPRKIADTLDEILMLAKLNQNGNPLLAWKFSVLPWRTVCIHIPTCKFYALSSKFEHNWERKCTGSVAHMSGMDPFSGSA